MNCAIIVAGGRGHRMNSNISKQYLKLKDKPILFYSLKTFSEHELIQQIILVVPEGDVDYCRKEIIQKYNIKKVSHVIEGGKERQDSVILGLEAVKDCDIVLIHDGARPFASDRLVEEGIKFAKLYGACACGVTPKDTIKKVGADNFSKGTIERNHLFCIQTPQCFNYDLIYQSHSKMREENIKVTDDTSVIEAEGHNVYLYQGNYNNIKITTPEDLVVGEEIAKELGY